MTSQTRRQVQATQVASGGNAPQNNWIISNRRSGCASSGFNCVSVFACCLSCQYRWHIPTGLKHRNPWLTIAAALSPCAASCVPLRNSMPTKYTKALLLPSTISRALVQVRKLVCSVVVPRAHAPQLQYLRNRASPLPARAASWRPGAGAAASINRVLASVLLIIHVLSAEFFWTRFLPFNGERMR